MQTADILGAPTFITSMAMVEELEIRALEVEVESEEEEGRTLERATPLP